jgi:hypothetical protein
MMLNMMKVWVIDMKKEFDLRRETLGHNHSDTLKSMRNIGNLLQNQGIYTEAEPLLADCLE